MKIAYPVIFTKDECGYIVYSPDFDANTQGADLPEAIEMARDLMGVLGITREDDGLSLPSPSSFDSITADKNSFVSLVDVDFAEYRRQNDMMSVKKNCTLPNWLCIRAEKANLNFSQILQNGLKAALHIAE